jgi:hypothetical protein
VLPPGALVLAEDDFFEKSIFCSGGLRLAGL